MMLERSFKGEEYPSVYCCLCTEVNTTQNAEYECDTCHRFICYSCLQDLKIVGLKQCPYCATTIFHKNIESSGPLDGKSGIKSVESWKKLGKFYYQRKNWELSKFFLLKVLKYNPEDKQVKIMYIEADYRSRSYF